MQVKPDRLEEFERLIETVAQEQKLQKGCTCIKYLKRFYIFDDINEPPRQLTKIVKCVKYYSFWEFDTIESYSQATQWFFATYSKELFRQLSRMAGSKNPTH